MIEYSEKRDFLRMSIECPARYRSEGAGQAAAAVVKNISGSGLLLATDQPLEAGALLALEVLPGKTITPPLAAYVRVVRSDSDDQGGYSVACTIERILGEYEVGPGFP
jgi:PilZ domain